jgi:hypothetical protein
MDADNARTDFLMTAKRIPMQLRWTSILAAVLLVGGVACGDDDPKGNGGTGNNTTANNTTPNNTSANNTTPNNTSTNNTTPNNSSVTADVVEVEPNGFGEGDTPTPFMAGQSIGGTIAEGAGETADVDRFSFTGQAGQVLTVSVESAGAGTQDLGTDQLVIVVASEDDAVVRQLLTSTGLRSRQVFLPQDGTYFLEVLDERAGGDATHGGDDATYVIGTDVSTVEPDMLTVPSEVDGDSSDGTIAAYSTSLPEDTVVVFETFAGRLATPSELDTVLVVFDPAAGEVVAENDDFLPQEEMIFDSRVAFAATAGTEYLVIVDAYSASANGAFRLEASATDDSPEAPTTIALGDSVTGDIDERDGDEFDTDYFGLSLQPNEFARVEVTGDDQLQPRLLVSLEGVGVIAEARPVGNTAAVEFAAGDFEEAQNFTIIVDDQRNTPEDENGTPADVGGAGFDYTLTASAATWTPTPVTLPYSDSGTISTIGSTNWYSFDVAAGDVLVAEVITTETDFTPVLVQLSEENFDFPVGDTPYIVGAAEMTSFVMGVRDEFFRGGASAEYLVDFSTITPAVVAESEPNDDQGNAQSITLPARITGVTDGTNESATSPDYFSFTAAAGDKLTIFTAPGTDMAADDADTVLTLLDSAGMELATNDDVSFGNTFSEIVFEVTTAGTYTVVLEPYCTPNECTNGDYSMTVLAN